MQAWDADDWEQWTDSVNPRRQAAGWSWEELATVILDHGGGYFTVSGHLAGIDIAVGDAVAVGARVGSVGDTGSL